MTNRIGVWSVVFAVSCGWLGWGARDANAGNDCRDGKLVMCHVPDDGGAPRTICIGAAAEAAHLAHGDAAGECDGTGGGTGLTCGAGTVEVDGVCVPDSPLACGPGTVEAAGECVPDLGAVCGDGTVAVGGQCVPVVDVACGPDTALVDGACLCASACADADADGVCDAFDAETCGDGVDNEGDGLSDCADPDCAADPVCGPELVCDDGIDNDFDGLPDCADPDCAPDPACGPEVICDDAVDNDFDGLVDCDDPDCGGHPFCVPELDCEDGIDNDLDGAIDCADPDCATTCRWVSVNLWESSCPGEFGCPCTDADLISFGALEGDCVAYVTGSGSALYFRADCPDTGPTPVVTVYADSLCTTVGAEWGCDPNACCGATVGPDNVVFQAECF